jgi:hypothetical protein
MADASSNLASAIIDPALRTELEQVLRALKG